MYDLKDLQKKELEMLEQIHFACEKLGIRYFIMYGSLLGAVRHKGFIPWDDDMDICMTREDYDVFIEKGQQYLPENLQIQHYTTEEDCPNIYIKVRDRNTTFLHKEHVDLDINQGIFVDVFPVERIKAGKWHQKTEYLKRRIFYTMNNCYDQGYVDSIIRTPSKIIGWCVHNILDRIFIRSRASFIRREDLRRRRLHQKGDDLAYIMLPIKKTIAPYHLFDEQALYEIDGKQFWGPKNYDEILTILYKDYMQLPPEDQRVTHQPLFVDLERGYTKEELKAMNFSE